jgi:hypothetical protein
LGKVMGKRHGGRVPAGEREWGCRKQTVRAREPNARKGRNPTLPTRGSRSSSLPKAVVRSAVPMKRVCSSGRPLWQQWYSISSRSRWGGGRVGHSITSSVCVPGGVRVGNGVLGGGG